MNSTLKFFLFSINLLLISNNLYSQNCDIDIFIDDILYEGQLLYWDANCPEPTIELNCGLTVVNAEIILDYNYENYTETINHQTPEFTILYSYTLPSDNFGAKLISVNVSIEIDGVSPECSYEETIEFSRKQSGLTIINKPEVLIQGCETSMLIEYWTEHDISDPYFIDLYVNDQITSSVIISNNIGTVSFAIPAFEFGEIVNYYFVTHNNDCYTEVHSDFGDPFSVILAEEVMVERIPFPDDNSMVKVFPNLEAHPKEWMPDLPGSITPSCCIPLGYVMEEEYIAAVNVDESIGFEFFGSLFSLLEVSNSKMYTVTSDQVSFGVKEIWNVSAQCGCIIPTLNLQYGNFRFYRKLNYCSGDSEIIEVDIISIPLRFQKGFSYYEGVCSETAKQSLPPDCSGNLKNEKGNISTTRNTDDLISWFTPTLSSVCTYSFENQSCGDGLEYEWDFGDGSTSTNEQPSPHQYTEPGAYLVTLWVTDIDDNLDYHADSIIIESCNPFEITGEIYGPSNTDTYETETYEVNAVGGVGPYEFEWYPPAGGQLFGEEVQIEFTETEENIIEVGITDANGSVAFVEKTVNVSFNGEDQVTFSHGPVIEGFPISLNPEYNWVDMDGTETLKWFLGGSEWQTGFSPTLPALATGEMHQVRLEVHYNGQNTTSEIQTIGLDPLPNTDDVCITIKGKTSAQGSWSFSNDRCGCNQNNANYESLTIIPGQETFWRYGWVNTSDCINGGDFNLQDDFFCGNNQHKLNYKFTNQNTLKVITNAPNNPGYECKPHYPSTFEAILDDWGCWDVEIKVGDATGFFPVTKFVCAVYVEPNELRLNDVIVEESSDECDEFVLIADVSNGAYESGNVINGTSSTCDDLENIYKSYTWKCSDLHGNPIDLLIQGGYGMCAQIDMQNAFFDDLYSERKFIVTLTIEDYLGVTKSKTKEINLGKKLNIRYPNEVYACPNIATSIFGDGSGVAVEGGTPPYTYTYTGISHPFEDIISWYPNNLPITQELPASNDPYIFDVIVQDQKGCTDLHRIHLNVKEVEAFAGDDVSVCGQMELGSYESFVTLGHPDGTASGGSGPYSYTYRWSPAYRLDDYRKEHPTVLKGEPNDSQLFKVTVTDNSGCTATDEVFVTYTDASDLALQAWVDHTAMDQVVCFGEEGITLGSLNGSECYIIDPDDLSITYCNDNLVRQWATTHPYEWNPEGVTNPILPVEMTSIPGTYDFMVTITDPTTQCSATDTKSYTIREKIRYEGYESVPVWKVGQNPIKLWNSIDNHIITDNGGAELPLSYEWVNKSDEDQLFWMNYVNGIPSNGTVFGPLDDGPLKMRVTDANECEIDILTSHRAQMGAGGAQIRLEPYTENGGDGAIVCPNEAICWNIEVDTRFNGQNMQYLPSQIELLVELSGGTWVPFLTETITVDLSDPIKGTYEGNYCYTPSDGIVGNSLLPARLYFWVTTDLGGYENKFQERFDVWGDQEQSFSSFITFCGEHSDNAPYVKGVNVIAMPDTDDYPHIGNSSGKCGEYYMPQWSGTFSLIGGLLGSIKVEPEYDDVTLNIEKNNFFTAAINPCLYSYRPAPPIVDSIPSATELSEYTFNGNSTILDINSDASSPSISIYPNPFSENIRVEVNFEWEGQLNYSIINMMGALIEEKNVNRNTQGDSPIMVDGSLLQKGMYLLQIEVNNEKFVTKIIKN